MKKRTIFLLALLLFVVFTLSCLSGCGYDNQSFDHSERYQPKGTIQCDIKLREKEINRGEDLEIEFYYGLDTNASDFRDFPFVDVVAMYVTSSTIYEWKMHTVDYMEPFVDYKNLESAETEEEKIGFIKDIPYNELYYDYSVNYSENGDRISYRHHETVTLPEEYISGGRSKADPSQGGFGVGIIAFDKNDDGLYVAKYCGYATVITTIGEDKIKFEVGKK